MCHVRSAEALAHRVGRCGCVWFCVWDVCIIYPPTSTYLLVVLYSTDYSTQSVVFRLSKVYRAFFFGFDLCGIVLTAYTLLRVLLTDRAQALVARGGIN